jgi:hypothetical protein
MPQLKKKKCHSGQIYHTNKDFNYFLPVFIPALILRIWSSPSAIKWALFCINSATLHQSK